MATGFNIQGPSLERQRTVMTFEDLITCLQGKESLVLLDRSFEDKNTSQIKHSPQTTGPSPQTKATHPTKL